MNVFNILRQLHTIFTYLITPSTKPIAMTNKFDTVKTFTANLQYSSVSIFNKPVPTCVVGVNVDDPVPKATFVTYGAITCAPVNPKLAPTDTIIGYNELYNW